MLSLALGPERRVKYYPCYYMSGFKFHTLQGDENKKTQNCGVMVKGENQIDSVPWYGVLKDVVELCYTTTKRAITVGVKATRNTNYCRFIGKNSTLNRAMSD